MSKHTDGPWECGGYSVEAADGSLICNMSGWRNAGANKANERLIAAAPDLLEWLSYIAGAADMVLRNKTSTKQDMADALKRIESRARAAIAKAEAV